MTALIGGTVERTFSMIGSFLTGLPGQHTHEAGCKDFGYFGQALGWQYPVCGYWVRTRDGHGSRTPLILIILI
jgi:hypothetical protein